MTELDHVFDAALLHIDLENRRAAYKGKPIDLTLRLFKMLACIHADSPRLVKGNVIFEAVWGGRAEEAEGSNLYHTRSSLNEALQPHGLEIENRRRQGFRIRVVSETLIASNIRHVSKKKAESQGSIRLFSAWSEAEPIMSSAKRSIVIVDSFFSEFGALDRWVRNALEQGSKRLDISVYMASPDRIFGAQRIKEKEEPADDHTTFKDTLANEPTDREVGLYRDLFHRYSREIDQRLRKHPVSLSIFEYPSMPSLRIFVVDDIHFVFGWFPLLDQNPEYPCLYLLNRDLTGANVDLAKKLKAQVENIQDISRAVGLSRRPSPSGG